MKQWLAILGVGWLSLAACTSRERVEPDESPGQARQALELTGSEVRLSLGAANSDFGGSLALEGNRLVVGARRAACAAGSCGAAYVFDRPAGGAFTLSATLTSSAPAANDSFGSNVALSGDRVMVDMPGRACAANTYCGPLLFERQANGSYQAVTITLSQPKLNVSFGAAFALSGTRALVSASHESCAAGQNCGAVYVLERQANGSFAEVGKLVASDASAFAYFGYRISLDGDRAAISAIGDACSGKLFCGAVYIFDRQANGTWLETKITEAPRVIGHDFGFDVDLDGDRLTVGSIDNCTDCWAPPTSYIFERQANGTWPEVFRAAYQADLEVSAQAVALDGDIAVTSGMSSGPFVLERGGQGTWSVIGNLRTKNGDGAGGVNDVSGSTVALGAAEASCAAGNYCGAVYIYERDNANGWPRPVDGTTCESKYECASGFCSDGVCCNTACTAPGYACIADRTNQTDGICATEPNGKPCTSADQCGSGFCVDKFCCDKACDADGYACAQTKSGSADGTCVAVPNGHGCANVADCGSGFCVDNTCCNTACTEGGYACGGWLTGQADGVCAPIPVGSTCTTADQCGSGFCIDGYCCDTLCDGDAESCKTIQTGLPNGQCGPVKNGQSCSANAQCGSNHCADGLCCDSTCAGTCESCRGQLTGGQDGQCLPIPEGQDPAKECEPLGSGACQTTGSCNGERGCATHEGEACGNAATCAAGGLGVQPGNQCSSLGLCETRAAEDCGAYRCLAGECLTTCELDQDCESPNRCISGRCRNGTGVGAACDTNDECDSGQCAEGVCCEAVCDGPCESCLAQRNGLADGQCGPIEAGRAPKRASACPQAGEVCGADGKCDGDGSCRVAAPEGTNCGTACTEGSEQIRACDGFGQCATTNVESCLPYDCVPGGTTCASRCATNADCAAGAVCDRDAGECAVSDATCKDGFTVLTPEGQEHDCAPYRCVAGACRDACSTSNDCASGYACEGSSCRLSDSGEGGATTEGDVTRAKTDSGCGCRAAGTPAPAGAGWLASILLAGFALRRRRAWRAYSLGLVMALSACKKDVDVAVKGTDDGNNDQTLEDCADATPPETRGGPSMVPVGRAGGGCVWIDATEVTGEQMASLAQLSAEERASFLAEGCEASELGAAAGVGALPMTNVDWCEAATFCAFAGKRLCGEQDSESEWQTVCTDGDNAEFPYQELADPDKCRIQAEEPVPSGSLATCATPTGVLDLVGNVREWTAECNGTSPQAACAVRGGSYLDDAGSAGCEARKSVERNKRSADLGFRCCADQP